MFSLPAPDAPAAGWIDLSGRAKLRLSGGDRVRFLNGQASNDVRALRPGEAMFACVMTAKGKMSADLFARAWPGDALLVDAEPDLREALFARLDRYIIADDVLLEDVTDEWALAHAPAPFAPGAPPEGVLAFAAERFGLPGTDWLAPASRRDVLRAWLGPGEWTTAEAERARLAAGVPRWGAELDEDTIPVEAGLEERAISYTKGCYIGQEVISRIKSVGRVKRRLCRLRAVAALGVGDELRPADAPPESRAAGQVTSAAPDGRGGFLALGYLRRPHDAPGTTLHLPDGTLVEVW